MKSIEPAVDEDVGCEGSVQYDLEYRRKGCKLWRLGGDGPLPTHKGVLLQRSVERAKRITIEDETIHYPGGSAREPKLEFRIVRKEFVVKRKLISERVLR